MELSSELLSQFAKITKDDTKIPEVGVQVDGTARLYNGKIYVQLDGSDQLTPVISSTAGMKDGDRVTVTIKDHTAKVTGNVSSPSAGQGDIDDAKQEIGNKITEVEILIADKVSTKEFDAEKARIDNLVADNVVIKDKLTATDAEIKNLTADNVTINQNLTAQNAEIENLKAKKLDVDIADIKYATVGNLEATNANIHNLQVDYGEFKKLSTDKIAANEGAIKKLDTEKLSATEADLKYANIDFANIGKAAIENLFSKSGMIGDLVVGEGTITGTLVGVTIKGDLIEGGTVKADKLVVQGEDGLYYKLNVTGEKVSAQQTEYNSLNGSIITAKSITAEKVNVHDLVAFGATIGGFHITDSALYSGVKDSVNNTTRGTYMNDDGEFAIGDSANYLKFYKDTDGTYKLAISAKEIKMSSSNVSIETIVDEVQNDVNNIKSEAIKTTQEQFYPSTSPTELVGGYWSSTQPTWKDGIYLWRRTLVTYISGDTAYTPSLKGVCITGNTGEAGGTGVGIASVADRFYLSSSNLELKDGSWVTVRPNWKQGRYIWTRYEITYTDGSTEQTYPVCVTGPTGNSGNGIDNIKVLYAKSTSNSNPPSSGWLISTPTWEDGKYIWSKTVTTYTDGKSIESAPVCISGSKGDRGPQGLQGIQGPQGDQGIQGPAGQNGSDGKTSYFHIKYAPVQNPSASQMSEIPNIFIGTYVDYEQADSADPNKYTWSRFQGLQGSRGENGIPGKNGVDGKTSYLHIAYANSADGSSGFSTTDSAGKLYIGQYTDFTEADSTDRTKYSWTKIKGETGAAGKPGADGIGIKNVDVMYAKSASNATAPVSGWQTTAPTWENGKYIWSKTVTTYTNGASKESAPACITGEKGSTGSAGADGKPGAAGVGVTSIVEQYYQSTSATTPTGGSWTTTYPAWVNGKYLWTRSVITYTNGTSKQTSPICVTGQKGDTGATGADGKPGAAGVGVKSSSVTYQAGSSGTTIPSGNWSSTIPSVAAGQYLWTKTVLTYTDGKSTTSYSVGRMGQNGSNGSPGAAGVGIKSTAVTYQAGASQTSAPTGSWTTSVPKLSAAMPYLWTRTIITYTNSTTSTSYSVGSTLDGVVVGGRNLFKGSGNLTSSSFGYLYINVTSVDSTQDETVPSGRCTAVTFDAQSTYPGGEHIGVCLKGRAFADRGIKERDAVAVSVWLKSSKATTSNFKLIPEFLNTSISLDQRPLTTSWQKYTAVGFANKDVVSGASEVAISLYNSEFGKGRTTIYVSSPQVEFGNRVTDWTPAPEDVQSGIDDAQTDANNANNKIDQQIPNIEYAKSQIDILNRSIASLVVDQNGGSLMTQTSGGWQFNIGSIQSALNGAIGDIQDVKGDINGVTDLANKTNRLANDVAAKTAYINMTQDESGQPVMELGQQNGEFKLRITNTSMDFMQGSQKIAYLSNRQLYIQSSVVTDEMKIGATSGYIWKKRGNGNMGLRYVSS